MKLPTIKIELTLSDDAQAFISALVNNHHALIMRRLSIIESGVDEIALNQERMTLLMQEETRKIIQGFNDATNAVAAKLQAVIEKAAQQGTLTEAQISAELSPILAHLQALGADETNPVPEVPPEAPPASS